MHPFKIEMWKDNIGRSGWWFFEMHAYENTVSRWSDQEVEALTALFSMDPVEMDFMILPSWERFPEFMVEYNRMKSGKVK